MKHTELNKILEKLYEEAIKDLESAIDTCLYKRKRNINQGKELLTYLIENTDPKRPLYTADLENTRFKKYTKESKS